MTPSLSSESTQKQTFSWNSEQAPAVCQQLMSTIGWRILSACNAQLMHCPACKSVNAWWMCHKGDVRPSIKLVNFCGRGLVARENRPIKSLNHDTRRFYLLQLCTISASFTNIQQRNANPRANSHHGDRYPESWPILSSKKERVLGPSWTIKSEDFIDRQNRPILSIIWHPLNTFSGYIVIDPLCMLACIFMYIHTYSCIFLYLCQHSTYERV